tara:strand:- start:1189 stop:1878 length:690 start_codon:yes stop_codon:yes gene_type:complete
MSNVLVVAAHPDDEVLGCGGTIAKHINQGDEVHVIILAEGITSRDKKRNTKTSKKQLNQLIESAKQAHDILGTTSIKFFDFPDNRMDSIDLLTVVKIVEKELSKITPDIIYTHYENDLNIDHQITNRAVITACRPYPNQSVRKILAFEVQSSTDWQSQIANKIFTPNHYINISDYLDFKLKALEAYSSEMRSWPHSRSIKAVEHLALWRGSTVGIEAAESFQLIRQIEN